MRLVRGDHAIFVSPVGGSILGWEWRNQQILGPTYQTQVNGVLKLRGETHWCFPNFGTDPTRMHKKHGWLRETQLQLVSNSPSYAAFASDPKWERPVAIGIELNVDENGIRSCLKIHNRSQGRIPVLPALHPYFAVPEGGWNVVAGEVSLTSHVDNDDLAAGFPFGDFTKPVVVVLEGVGRITVKTSLAETGMFVWSDRPSNYICVEEVFGKIGKFGDEHEGAWLNPGQHAAYNVEFGFRPE